MIINESIRKVRGYPVAVKRSTNRSLKDNIPVVAKMNVQQMEIGMKPDGTKQENYSPVSVDFYGKQPGPILLRDAGDFHRGVEKGTKVKDNTLTLQSDDWKSDMLDEMYEPFGLTEKNMDKEVKILFDDLVKDLRKYWK